MKLNKIIAACALLGCAGAALAQSAGSVIWSAGWTHVAPQNGTPHFETFELRDKPAEGTAYRFGHGDTLGLNADYFMTDNVAAWFSVNVPPRLGIKTEAGKTGSVRFWDPAAGLKYFFLPAETKLRPFAGIGISRIFSRNINIKRAGIEDSPNGAHTISIDSRWAGVFTVGALYQLDERWVAGLDINYMPVRTDLDFKAADGRLMYRQNTKVNPISTYVHLGYRF